MGEDNMAFDEIERLILGAGRTSVMSSRERRLAAGEPAFEETNEDLAAQQALLGALPSEAEWEGPFEELFSTRAREVALLLGEHARNGLMGLLRDLRGWDERVDRREDVFQLFAPLLKVAAARRREVDDRRSHLYSVRRHLAETVTSAQALYVARWFFETVRSFQIIEFARRREAKP